MHVDVVQRSDWGVSAFRCTRGAKKQSNTLRRVGSSMPCSSLGEVHPMTFHLQRSVWESLLVVRVAACFLLRTTSKRWGGAKQDICCTMHIHLRCTCKAVHTLRPIEYTYTMHLRCRGVRAKECHSLGELESMTCLHYVYPFSETWQCISELPCTS